MSKKLIDLTKVQCTHCGAIGGSVDAPCRNCNMKMPTVVSDKPRFSVRPAHKVVEPMPSEVYIG